MSAAFPIALAANAFATTAFVVALGLCGRSEMAAEVALAQAAIVLVFQSLLGDARNIALAETCALQPAELLRSRLLLMPLQAVLAWLLATVVLHVPQALAAALVARRAVEAVAELHLSEREREGDGTFAARSALLQLVLWGVMVPAAAFLNPAGTTLLWTWAVGPVVMCLPFLRRALDESSVRIAGWKRLLPHLGSTTVIAAGVFVFRSQVQLLAGRAAAGELFTAFALGGLWPSLYATAVGPSVERANDPQVRRRVRMVFWLLTGTWGATGVAVLLAAHFAGGFVLEVRASPVFWQAVGCSFIGGAAMAAAQRIRIEVLQRTTNHLLGPDVMINVLIVVSVPAAWYLAGGTSLAGLYLWNAALTLTFYLSARRGAIAAGDHTSASGLAISALCLLLVLPIFVQAHGGLFHVRDFLYDSEGQLDRLPIPLSVPACFAGLLALAAWKRSVRSLGFILATAMILLLTPLVASSGGAETLRPKLVLAVQTILPLPALVLGEFLSASRASRRRFEAACLATVAVIVPLQLAVSWAYPLWVLHSDLKLFSIYQHVQYVPVVIVLLYLIALFSRFRSRRSAVLLVTLAPLVGIYAAASSSMLAVGLALAGGVAFAWVFRRHQRWRMAVTLGMLMTICAGSYLMVSVQFSRWMQIKYGALAGRPVQGTVPPGGLPKVVGVTVPPNLAGRFECWTYYADRLLEGGPALWTGHDQPPPRSRFPSAHNYYIDLAYNFGLPAAAMFVGLAGWTLAAAFRNRRRIARSPTLLAIFAATVFLFACDNMLKVGFRQPYPGIISFLLWGMLQQRLSRCKPCSGLAENAGLPEKIGGHALPTVGWREAARPAFETCIRERVAA